MSSRNKEATKTAKTTQATVTGSAKKKVANEREKTEDRDEEAFTIVITATDEIDCPVCARDSSIPLICLSAQELESHCKEEHENIRIIWKCKTCLNPEEYSTAHGLRIHATHCPGEVRVEPELPFKCDECGSSFKKEMGLSQHLRHRHPEVLDAKKAERQKGRAGRPPYLVTEAEFAELKRLDKQYRGIKQINAKIRKHFPQLTCKQISDLRRRFNDSSSCPEGEESRDEGEDATESHSRDE